MQVDSKMTRGRLTLCRVCLTMAHDNRCIFQIGKNWDDLDGTDTPNLSEKIRLCCGVEILESDGLPASICSKCFIKVNTAYELRKQCQKADMELRQVYGKTLRTNITDNYIVTKDQYCQTEQSFTLDVIKTGHNTELNVDKGSNIENSIHATDSMNIMKHEHEQIPDDFNQTNNTKDILVDNESDLDCINKFKQIEHEKVSKKEVYRTRRLRLFKRVTSIENMRNYKERQRRYIKKSANVKRDSNDCDYQTKTRSTHSRTDRTSKLKLQYKCPKCDRFYSSKRSLNKHKSTHDDAEFKCDVCDKQFSCLDKLLKHINLHKTKEKPEPVLCGICNKSFRKIDTMVRHLNVHKKANPKEVFSILKEIRDKRKLENNLESSCHATVDRDEETTQDKRSQGENGGAKTRELRKRNARAEQRDSDLATNDPRNDESEYYDDTLLFHCKYCSKRYSTESSLLLHVSEHGEKKFVCNVCNKKFFRQDRLKSHMERYGHDEARACSEPQELDDKSAIKLINSWIKEALDSDNEDKGFPCKICGKSYDTRKSLLKHEVNAHGGQDEYCASCSGACTCADKCKDPERSNEKSKSYTCEECNKSFEKESKLQRHLRIHERAREQQDANFKRFLCHICSKTFRQNTGLMFHMRTHTGYKPHVCKYCGRGFTSNSNCINHERTHTGDRPFVCQYCSAAFAKSCTLKAHITTHTGEANYHCKICGKSFRRLKYLKEHRFTHTGEKPYACKICGTAYSHSGSLFVHEKKCRMQYNNYQSAGAAENPLQQQIAYGQSPQITGGVTAASHSSVVTPIITPITTLPQTHLNVINSTLNVQTNKDYMDNVQRMNAYAAAATATTIVTPGLHSSADIPEMSSTVRNFTLGQIFHT